MKILYSILLLFFLSSSSQAKVAAYRESKLIGLDSTISDNTGTQLKTTSYSSGGVERLLGEDGEQVEIPYSHHKIHSGTHYFLKNYLTLTNAQVFDFLAVVPTTTTEIHMLVEFGFQAEATIIIYEGATTSADGTEITAMNRKRSVETASTLLLYHTPTVTGTGTQIAGYAAGSGKAAGGEIRAAQEMILKSNTKYLIRVTNATASDNWCDYLADWYEH